MPNWKKVVISGSNAELNEITSSAGIFINAPADGDPIFTVSGSNGQLLRVHDSASSTLFEVNDFSGISHFEVSGSGTLLAKNLEYKNEDFFLSYDSASGRIHFFSSSEFMPDGTISSSAQVDGASLGSNNTVSYGGIQLTLGGADGTPAFNLSDATSLPIGDGTTGTLPVNRGGTGVTTLSSGQVLIGNGTSDVSTTAIGISNGNIVKIDSTTVADNEYARFTANGLESRTAAEVASDMGAITDADGVFSASSQIDHDQLTNFAANEHFTQANITTVGTVTSGDVSGILPDGTVSGSSQIDGSSISSNTVGFGGVSVALGSSDGTPAFNLSDATAYPGDSSLVTLGTVTTGDVSGILPDGTVSGSSQIDGSSISSNTVSYGGVSVALGSSDGTPAFDLSDATSLPIGDGTTGTLPVNRGGTGVTSLSSGQVLIGNGTSDVSTTAIGISNGNIVKIDGTSNQPVTSDFAKFTANGLEGRSASEVASDIGAITDAAGVFSASAQIDHDQLTNFAANEHFTQANITTVGTVTTGDVSGILPDGTVSGSSQIDGASITNNAITIAGTSTALNGSITAATILNATNVFSGSSQVNGASITNNAITIAGTSTALNGSITAATILNGTGVVSGSTGDDLGNHTATQALDMAGNDINDAGAVTGTTITANTKLIVPDAGIEHSLDTDTKITFSTDQIDFTAGGVAFMTFDEAATDNIIFNEGGQDVNYRFETNGNANMVVIDGGDNVMGIGGTVNANSTLKVTGNLEVTSNITASGNLEVGGNLDVARYIRHIGDTNTVIDFTSDNISFQAGGTEVFDINGSSFVFNEGSIPGVDLRMESNSNTHMFYLAGNNNKIGINTSAPTHTFTVGGDISGSGDVHVGGNVYLSTGGAGLDFDSNTLIIGDVDGTADPIVEIRSTGNDANASGRLIIGDDNLDFQSGGTSYFQVASSEVNAKSQLKLTYSITNENTTATKFLTLDSGNRVDFRTAAEVLSDIGATSNTGTVTQVSVGTGLDVTNTTTHPTVSLDLQEIGQASQAMPSSDFFVCTANTQGTNRRYSPASIPLSIFNNDLTAASFTGFVESTASIAQEVSRSYSASPGAGTGEEDSTALRLIGSGSVSGSGIFEVEGSVGTLFTVADGLDDVIFAANNISGLPIIEANADNTVRLGKYGGFGIVISGSTPNPDDAAADIIITGSIQHYGSYGLGVEASSTLGRFDASNDVVAYSTSDRRLKENIKPIENALDKVSKISGVEFDWKELSEDEKKYVHGNEGHDIGVIAQEIESVLPEVVTQRDSGYKAVKYDKIVPLLIEAIKELQEEIKQLKGD